MIKHSITNEHLTTQKAKVSNLEGRIAELKEKLEQIPELESEVQLRDEQIEGLQTELAEVREQMDQIRGEKDDKSMIAKPEMEDAETQTEQPEDFAMDEDSQQMQDGQPPMQVSQQYNSSSGYQSNIAFQQQH
jgi:predicted RNase H-like nuclease (RuvC/YqgF family)